MLIECPEPLQLDCLASFQKVSDRQNKKDKICEYEHVVRVHFFKSEKPLCHPPLASAGLDVGVASDMDKILTPGKAVLVGS